MNWNIDPRYDIAVNADVMRFVREKNVSAHTDVSEELFRAVDGVTGAALYCPDYDRAAFVVAHLPDSRIFALAYGMKAYALRVGKEAEADAVGDGATVTPEIGPGWVTFDPFLVDVKTVDMRALLKRWTARAMEYVVGL